MADALISIVLERLAAVAEEQIRYHVNLVVGVDDEIESLMHTLQSIQDVLEDAERKQVKEISVRRWLEELKDVAYQMDDVVDEWSTSLLRLQSEPAETSASSSSTKKKKVSCCLPSPFFCFKQVASRHGIALKIQSIKQQLDAIDRNRKMLKVSLTKINEKPQNLTTTSRIDFSEVCGREMDQNTIIGHLLGEKGEQRFGLYIVSIVGTGGMGKTTLAQLAYNHPDVEAHFDQKIWVCVSDPFEPIRIFMDIVEILDKTSPDLHNLEALQQKVETCISGKKLLLVLDDVWTEDSRLWEQVKNTFSSGARGSRILVTTRKESVVKLMRSTYMHQLGELSQEESRALFNQIAFSEMSREKEGELKAIGERIADKCKGFPLAIKTMGNLMRSKKNIEEWEAVLNNELWKEDAFERDISPALWLSYYNLPPAIKRCFSFCAVFPKDKVIKRDQLIKVWMAHNYLNHNGNKEMEMIGKEYFEHLAAASFFQDFEKDGDDNIIKCKMHDIVHDFAQLLTKGECFIIESHKQSQGSTENGRHATFIVQEDAENIVSTSSMKNLHTLLISNPKYCNYTPPSFQHLTCLRALSLGWGSLIEKLPNEIGELIHLRYLDLSRCNELEELPETICNLHNLQTLNIKRCYRLKRLPRAIGKLTNLRHLQNSDNLESLPKGIGGLSSLQTLGCFIISSGDGYEKCRIGDFRNLNKLRGQLTIKGLNEVEDASEVEEAELEKNLEHIQELGLEFERGKTRKDVAEAIKLPPKLKALEVWDYEEVELPGWMMRSSSLTHLRRLELSSFSECSRLPPLGELPALEALKIESMGSLKYVGDEFVGSSSSSTIAFPKLKRLSLGDMPNWEKWEVKEDQQRSIMPSLEVMIMSRCPKLEALPDHLLQRTEWHHRWEIWNCPVLKQRYEDAFRIAFLVPRSRFR